MVKLWKIENKTFDNVFELQEWALKNNKSVDYLIKNLETSEV